MTLASRLAAAVCSFGVASVPGDRANAPPLPNYYLMDRERHAGLNVAAGGREYPLEVTHRVDAVGGRYKYVYALNNSGDYPYAVRWAVLNEVSGAENLMFHLEAGEGRIVEVESDSPPVWGDFGIEIWVMIRPDDKVWKDDIAAAGAKINGNFFYPIRATYPGPIPYSKTKVKAETK